MITFFARTTSLFYAVEHATSFDSSDVEKLEWLFESKILSATLHLDGRYIGPRPEMITPWSTNAVEITQNMNIEGIQRIEELTLVADENSPYDSMLQSMYLNPGQNLFTIEIETPAVLYIEDIEAYNQAEGLALSQEEIDYLHGVESRLGRPLTDSEVFGFSQINSEHCRHKIFNGTFIIDGQEKPNSLFGMIKSTSKENPNRVVSAYKDNVAFIEGNPMMQFAPQTPDQPDFFALKERDTVISIKAETHNFPTTVEPFNGAATGTGGEIRDRMSGGKASIPVAGTAVYMTSYHREGGDATAPLAPRPWLYQTPREILTKASNGASDFGNKFGQPLINGSLLTFEHQESVSDTMYGYDKVIMQAGGIGYAVKEDAQKETPQPGETVVVMGGDNYRIGMGGGAVSSVNTGQYNSGIELNAVQRANPEMQKRVQNVVRALSESDHNPIISIHDHGAGGHLNSLTELIEETGGKIDIDTLPIGDPSLSAKEILGNESQERMGLLIREEDYERVERIAHRERAPIYKVGKTTNDKKLLFSSPKHGAAIDLRVEDFLGSSPVTIVRDETLKKNFAPIVYQSSAPEIERYLDRLLSLDSVACKDWLTNKVDRSVTGKVARQQCVGELQLPLADLGAIAQDFTGEYGVATSLGHAPRAGLISPKAGSQLSIAEALTNLVFAPIDGGIRSVSLSANWMWPSKNPGEDARLYQAVESCAQFAKDLGINIPTGKDSLSMTQKYPDGSKVISPGTVIITAVAPTLDVRKIITPVLSSEADSTLIYIDFSRDMLALGGSAWAQSLDKLGNLTPIVRDPKYFAQAFEAVQQLIHNQWVVAGHDISDGGLLVTLLEMCFATRGMGAEITLPSEPADLVTRLFAENPGVVLQVREPGKVRQTLSQYGVEFVELGHPTSNDILTLHFGEETLSYNVPEKRELWFRNSYLLERYQTTEECAQARYNNYKNIPLRFSAPQGFKGSISSLGLRSHRSNEKSGVVAAILRNKGTNGDREMAYALHLAGFDVKDVHLTDLISGRETLQEVQMLVFCGGFSDSDVLGSAKGWAGGILYNEKARKAVFDFYNRPDTLSLGICNGCQLMAELGLLYPEHEKKHRLGHNLSGKFESGFVSLRIPENHSVMLGSLAGSELGVWVAHGEGRFLFPYDPSEYHVIAEYSYDMYPANPNGSVQGIAGICSADGRHLAMMPHPERAIFPWQCALYPNAEHEVTPWMIAFRNAYEWIVDKNKK